MQAVINDPCSLSALGVATVATFIALPVKYVERSIPIWSQAKYIPHKR